MAAARIDSDVLPGRGAAENLNTLNENYMSAAKTRREESPHR